MFPSQYDRKKTIEIQLYKKVYQIGSNMFMSVEKKEPNPLGSSTTIPMPMMTSTESLRANGMERNKGSWYLFKHNWRQLTSLTPGKL